MVESGRLAGSPLTRLDPPRELFRLTISKPLPSYNEILGRGSRWDYRNLKDEWKQTVAICAAAAGIHGMLLEGPMGLQVARYGARELDVDNLITKPMVDGLRHARVIVEDKPKVVAWIHTESYACKKERDRRTEVIAWSTC